MLEKKRLLVFASGSKSGGGSGFLKLIEAAETGILQAEIVGVASNHANGGVRRIADAHGINFQYFPGPYQAEEYRHLVNLTEADYVALSGWLKLVTGLAPATTVNIHPGPLPEFGGPGMYGHHVHEAVIQAFSFSSSPYGQSAVSMHFVDAEYDRGPVFFSMPVAILRGDTSDNLAERVNRMEHGWQAWVTNLIITEEIWLDNSNGRVFVPHWYGNMPFCPDAEHIHLYT